MRSRSVLLTYLEMVTGEQKAEHDGEPRTVEQVKYVFTDPEGARENLPWMVKRLQKARDLDEGAVIVEVFDEAGTKHTLSDVDEMLSFLEAAP